MTATPGAPPLGASPDAWFTPETDDMEPQASVDPVPEPATLPYSPSTAVAPAAPIRVAEVPQQSKTFDPRTAPPTVEHLPSGKHAVAQSARPAATHAVLPPGSFTKEAATPKRRNLSAVISDSFYYDAEGHRKLWNGARRAMVEEINALREQMRAVELDDTFSIVDLSTIGGIGKTYTTANLGRIIATSRRREALTCIDINPDHGVLAERLGVEESGSLQDVYQSLEKLDSLPKIQKMVRGDDEGISVIAGDWKSADPADFSEEQFFEVFDRFRKHTTGILCDGGTGLLKATINLAALRCSNQLVYVTRLGREGWKTANADFDQLAQRGFKEHLKRAIVIVSMPAPKELSSGSTAEYSYRHFQSHFLERVRGVYPVMYDPFLATREPVDLARLSTAVLLQYHRIALAALQGCQQFVPQYPKTPPATAARQQLSKGE